MSDHHISKVPEIESIYVEITERCNFKCSYCYNSSEQAGHLMDYRVFERICEYCSEHGVLGISISGGEPFLHPRLFDMIHCAAKRSLPVIVITNGGLITQETIQQLSVDEPIIRISIDSLKREIFENRKGKGTFDKAMSGFMNLTNAGYRKFSVRINVDYDNYAEVPEMITYFALHKVKEIYLSLIVPTGRGSESAHLGLESDPDMVQQLISYRDEFSSDATRVYFESGVCMSCPYVNADIMTLTLAIDAYGAVYPCMLLRDDEFKMGNVSRSSIPEILRNKKFQTFSQMIKLRTAFSKTCQRCKFSSICGGGCPADAYNKTGNIFGVDGNCSERRAAIEEGVHRSFHQQSASLHL